MKADGLAIRVHERVTSSDKNGRARSSLAASHNSGGDSSSFISIDDPAGTMHEDEAKEALLSPTEHSDCSSHSLQRPERPCRPPRLRHTLLPIALKTMYVLAFLSALPLLARGLSSLTERDNSVSHSNGYDGQEDYSKHGGHHGHHGKKKKDKYGGKTLAPSNVTVVTGLFRQDDPELDPEGYDMLKDSFGLLDKSHNRWKKFTK